MWGLVGLALVIVLAGTYKGAKALWNGVQDGGTPGVNYQNASDPDAPLTDDQWKNIQNNEQSQVKQFKTLTKGGSEIAHSPGVPASGATDLLNVAVQAASDPSLGTPTAPTTPTACPPSKQCSSSGIYQQTLSGTGTDTGGYSVGGEVMSSQPPKPTPTTPVKSCP